MVSLDVHFSEVVGVLDDGELAIWGIQELGGRLGASVKVSELMGAGDCHLGILLDVLELSEIEKNVEVC
jgi:hypothetical protein